MKRNLDPLLAPDGSGLQSTYHTVVICGPNGCGKTTLAEKIAHYYARGTKVTGRVWAIDPNASWVGSPGVKSLWPKDGNVDPILADSVKWKPGLIILDDADRSYFRRSSSIHDDYLTSNRHNRKDLMILCRRPQGIPKDAIMIARAVILFAGSLSEPHALKYWSECFPEEIISAVPKAPYHYLKIIRNGGLLSYSRGHTTPRKIKNASDKT